MAESYASRVLQDALLTLRQAARSSGQLSRAAPYQAQASSLEPQAESEVTELGELLSIPTTSDVPTVHADVGLQLDNNASHEIDDPRAAPAERRRSRSVGGSDLGARSRAVHGTQPETDLPPASAVDPVSQTSRDIGSSPLASEQASGGTTPATAIRATVLEGRGEASTTHDAMHRAPGHSAGAAGSRELADGPRVRGARADHLSPYASPQHTTPSELTPVSGASRVRGPEPTAGNATAKLPATFSLSQGWLTAAQPRPQASDCRIEHDEHFGRVGHGRHDAESDDHLSEPRADEASASKQAVDVSSVQRSVATRAAFDAPAAARASARSVTEVSAKQLSRQSIEAPDSGTSSGGDASSDVTSASTSTMRAQRPAQDGIAARYLASRESATTAGPRSARAAGQSPFESVGSSRSESESDGLAFAPRAQAAGPQPRARRSSRPPARPAPADAALASPTVDPAARSYVYAARGVPRSGRHVGPQPVSGTAQVVIHRLHVDVQNPPAATQPPKPAARPAPSAAPLDSLEASLSRQYLTWTTLLGRR